MSTSAGYASKKKLIATAVAAVMLVACAGQMKKPYGADEARAKLTQLQGNSQLASLAPVAIKDAEAAVVAAEQPQRDVELGKHLVFIADRKIDIAAAQAQRRLYEDQRKTLSEQREKARLDARTREADLAHGAVAAARQENTELQRQLDELNAKTTDRGIVITLGDVLFDTGKSNLKPGALNNLGKLVAFLNQYPDRNVTIEGHTDSVGSEEYNLSLSQRRADAVKSYLVHQGIAAARFTTAGLGEGSPVAGNDSAGGRQLNRRVEVIIENPASASK